MLHLVLGLASLTQCYQRLHSILVHGSRDEVLKNVDRLFSDREVTVRFGGNIGGHGWTSTQLEVRILVGVWLGLG